MSRIFTTTFKQGEAYSLYSRTELDFLLVQSAFQDGKNAYFNKKFELAIDSYNRSMAALEDIMSVLHLHRAAVYEMQGNYDQAINDCIVAEQKQTAAGSDSYLARASGYYFQHQFQNVLNTLENGINALPKVPLGQSVLYQKRDEMVKEIDSHNQVIIRVFPYEVLSHILSFTRTADQVQLALTCRSWERFIMHEWHNMWFTVNSQGFSTCTPPTRRFLARIPKENVRALVLRFDYLNLLQSSGPRRNGDYLWQYRNVADEHAITIHQHSIASGWNNLESLTINGFCHTLLRPVLRLNRGTLRHITVFRDRELENDIQLIIDLVNEQPILQSLTAHFIGKRKPGIQRAITIPPNIPRSHLTKLALDCDLTEESFTALLKSCPHLVTLKLRWGNTMLSPVLVSTRMYCKRLQILMFGNYAESSNFPLQIPDEMPGIKELSISTDDGFQDVSGLSTSEILEQLNFLLQDNHNSLQTLRLDGRLLGLTERGESICEFLVQHNFPSLLHFELGLYDTAWCPMNSQRQTLLFISSCPSIQTVKIKGPYTLFGEKVVEGIRPLRHLQSIGLSIQEATTHRTANDPYALQKQLNRGYAMSKNMEQLVTNAANMQKLSLDFPLVISTNNFDTILINITNVLATHCPGISEIRFYGLGLSTVTFFRILSNLKHTQVKRLSLPVPLDQSLTIHEIHALAAIQHLRELSLYDRNELFTELDMSALLEEFQIHPQLIVVYVYSGGVNYLKGHKPARYERLEGNDAHRRYTIEDLRTEVIR
ncbi:hypothetical protein BJV82DRAFT_661196 [Fennellomyces sp. T-0311]|nr:hypothetical protein BJV82DRAFT_661196 [Fennellomyces sp. T-0311]